MNPITISASKGAFLKVLSQTSQSQVATMTIKAGEDTGADATNSGDQIILVIEGEADIESMGSKTRVVAGQVITIPANTPNRIYSVGGGDLFALTIFAPPSY